MFEHTQTKTTGEPTRGQEIGRREFTIASAMAILSGVAVTISACSGSDSTTTAPTTPTPAPAPAPGNVTGAVSANHGHAATVTGAQITAAGDIAIDITGSADHPHTVQVTAAELTQIGAGQQVAKTSTTNSAHSHTVTFN